MKIFSQQLGVIPSFNEATRKDLAFVIAATLKGWGVEALILVNQENINALTGYYLGDFLSFQTI